MKNPKKEPFKMIFSFRYLKETFQELVTSNNEFERLQAQQALKIFEEYPVLSEGTFSEKEFFKNQKGINCLMSLLFPKVLTNNEIKAAVFPYSNKPFYTTKRLQGIMELASEDNIFESLYRDIESSLDFMSYAIILNKHYNFSVDFERPKTIAVTDKNGIKKRYRVAFNGDYLNIYPNKNAVEITQDILDELLANANDIEVWEKYFPEGSWTIEGFGIINLMDISLDEQIDDLKTHLIEPNYESFMYLLDDIRRIFNLPNLQIGSYTIEDKRLTMPYDNNFEVLTLSKDHLLSVNEYACININKRLFEEFKPAVISNVELYHKKTGGNQLSRTLLEKGLKSVALIPIEINGKLSFVLEMATNKANELNPINMVKLEVIMPFIVSYARRTAAEYKNEISAVIQEECTSIHPAVEWRFQEEAAKYIQDKKSNQSPVFNEIVFKDVLPLYGQVDIVGSSTARNEAIRLDLSKQLEISKEILQKRAKKKSFPYYEQLIYKINKFLYELKEEFHTNSEQEINLFFANQIFPVFEHLKNNTKNPDDVNAFLEILEPETKTLYDSRKQYDNTVDGTNHMLSVFLEKQQEKAQLMFPHYFEKFKTDGIEHNMYIGQSLVKYQKYSEVALHNLRLWQLQVTCEMEAMYYQNKSQFPVQLEVASLILAYDVPITIRYRIDEKQFDVDGAYNVRYELIKKRIDKALIKNTNERLTQPHKLCVVYSSNAVEREYLQYFEFLQSKNYIGKKIEIVEVEELQGASGIKAIRAEMNHQLEKGIEIFTVEDLQKA